MQERMWRHEVHSFLELLRQRLLASSADIVTFICPMNALLYAYVPSSRDTGGPVRYRVAIESDNLHDREAWSWYTKALDKAPTTSRLYHHPAILARPVTHLQLHCKYSCAPIPSLEPHHSWSNGLFEFGSDSDRGYDGDSKKAKTPNVCAHLTLPQHSDKLLSNSQNVYRFPLGLGPARGSRSSMPNLLRQTKRSLKNYVFSFALLLKYVAIASATPSRLNLAPESKQLGPPSTVSDDAGLAWLWYPTIAAALLAGEFAAVYILGNPLMLYGVSMGISAAAYLLMAFSQHEIPFHIQFSTWGICAILTIALTYYDTLNLSSETRRLAVLAVIVIGFLLDSGISSVFASASDSVFTSNDSPSTAFIFATFSLPCMVMSAFLSSGIQGLYCQVTQHWARTNTANVQTGL